MQLKLTINSQEVVTKSGTAKATGKPYSMREQHGLCALPNGEVRRVPLLLEADENPLVSGDYETKPEAFGFNKFGEPVISMRARHWRLVVARGAAKAA